MKDSSEKQGQQQKGFVNEQTLSSFDEEASQKVSAADLQATEVNNVDSAIKVEEGNSSDTASVSYSEVDVSYSKDEKTLPESNKGSLSNPKVKAKMKSAANAESPVLKSHEIFGAVKVKDG